MIADWKLEMMAKMIFEQIWQERKETVDTVCELIKECYQVEKPKKVNLTGIVAQIERYKNKKNTLLEMRTDGEISKDEYKEQKEKVEKALLELTEEYERMLATEDAIQNPDICWDEIQSSLNAMIDFSNPQIDRHIIRKFVSKIVPNGRNHFRWYMNLDGKDTTTIDMVTEGRKSNAVISFNDDEEDEPPLHIGDVIGLTELQQFFPNLLKNENQNGIISNVAKCGEKSSLDAILHRLLSRDDSPGKHNEITEIRVSSYGDTLIYIKKECAFGHTLFILGACSFEVPALPLSAAQYPCNQSPCSHPLVIANQ